MASGVGSRPGEGTPATAPSPAAPTHTASVTSRAAEQPPPTATAHAVTPALPTRQSVAPAHAEQQTPVPPPVAHTQHYQVQGQQHPSYGTSPQPAVARSGNTTYNRLPTMSEQGGQSQPQRQPPAQSSSSQATSVQVASRNDPEQQCVQQTPPPQQQQPSATSRTPVAQPQHMPAAPAAKAGPSSPTGVAVPPTSSTAVMAPPVSPVTSTPTMGPPASPASSFNGASGRNTSPSASSAAATAAMPPPSMPPPSHSQGGADGARRVPNLSRLFTSKVDAAPSLISSPLYFDGFALPHLPSMGNAPMRDGPTISFSPGVLSSPVNSSKDDLFDADDPSNLANTVKTKVPHGLAQIKTIHGLKRAAEGGLPDSKRRRDDAHIATLGVENSEGSFRPPAPRPPQVPAGNPDGSVCTHIGCGFKPTPTNDWKETVRQVIAHEADRKAHTAHIMSEGAVCDCCAHLNSTNGWIDEDEEDEEKKKLKRKDKPKPGGPGSAAAHENETVSCSHDHCGFLSRAGSYHNRKNNVRFHEKNMRIHVEHIRDYGDSCPTCQDMKRAGIWSHAEMRKLIETS